MNALKNQKSSGFTLIEQMITVAIIGILAMPLLNMYGQAKHFEEDHYRFTLAATILQKEMEYLKTTPISRIAKSGKQTVDEALNEDLAQLEGGNVKVKVSNMAGYPYVKRFEVIVEWANPWGQKRFLKSMILRPAQ